MLEHLAIAFALGAGRVAAANTLPPISCGHWLDLVSPLAVDPYERLGFEAPVPLPDVIVRFRNVTREYADHPPSLRRFADALDAIKMKEAEERWVETTRLPLVTQRRAHGDIRGNPHGGRFTIGYGIDPHGSPTTDETVLIRGVLAAEPARSTLLALPAPARPEFEYLIGYFAKNVQRVGVEGAFDDVIAHAERWIAEALGRPEHRGRARARDLFVELFAEIYVAARSDPKAPDAVRTRRILGRRPWPEPPAWRSIEERLESELDPRTFLRLVIHHFRIEPAALNGPTLGRLSTFYQRRFFVEDAHFVQHLLFFATDQWTGRDLRVEDRRDRAIIQALLERLVDDWIIAPPAVGLAPRWFDFASVLWDAERVIAKQAYVRADARHASPFGLRLRLIEDEHPAVLAELRAERTARPASGHLLPW